MNKKIIALLIILITIFGFVFIKTYKAKDDYNTIYLLQVGAYKEYSNVSDITKLLNNYIVYEEDNLYKIFIGVSTNKTVLNMIDKSDNNYIKEIKVTNNNIYNKINKIDNVILSNGSLGENDSLVKESLKLIKEVLD